MLPHSKDVNHVVLHLTEVNHVLPHSKGVNHVLPHSNEVNHVLPVHSFSDMTLRSGILTRLLRTDNTAANHQSTASQRGLSPPFVCSATGRAH